MKALDLIAKMRPTEEFVAAAEGADIMAPQHGGKSLLMAALANTKMASRYASTRWLLDRGCPLGALNSEGYTELHVLFGHVSHDLAEDVDIARRLIGIGADVNAVSPRGGLVFLMALQMKFTDEQMEPLYELWFEQPVLDFETPSRRGGTPLNYARVIPWRAGILERMERYVAEHPA